MLFEKYTPPTFLVFQNGEQIGSVSNDVELARLQLVVGEKEMQGVTILVNGEHISISSKFGDLEKWPQEVYMQLNIEFASLVRMRRKKMGVAQG